MITRRKTEVVIYQGDDLERMAELKRVADKARSDYQQAKVSGSNRLGDIIDPTGDEQAFNDFVTEAAGRAVSVWLEAIGRKRFRELKRQHKPRQGSRLIEGRQTEVTDEDDADYGVNTETFSDALLTYHDPATGYRTITQPDFPTKEGLAEFLDELSEGDFDRLWIVAYHLNTAVGADPESLRYSGVRTNSSVTSE